MSSRSKRAGEAFHTVKEAKDFLAGRILDQADREGAPLTDVERKMLYFSESYSTLPNMAEVYDEFDRDYDQTAYEKKMAAIARRAYRHDWHDDSEDAYRWLGAIRRLNSEDHYLSVILHQAVIRPPHDSLKLYLSALVLALVLLAVCGAVEFFGDNWSVDFLRHFPSSGYIAKVGVFLVVAALAMWSLVLKRNAPRRIPRTTARADEPPAQDSSSARYLFMYDKETRDRRALWIAPILWCVIVGAALNRPWFHTMGKRNQLYFFLWTLVLVAAVVSLFTDRPRR